MAKYLSGVPHPYTLKDADDWLRVVNSEAFNLSVYLDDVLIGAVALSDQQDGTFELGYWIGVDYWGRGFATEAAGALLGFAASKVDPLLVTASVFQGNLGSAKVLEKLGFTEVGEGQVFSLSRQANVPIFKYVLSA